MEARVSMEYTAHQKEYIDSVEGKAHASAVRIIGELEAELQEARREVERLRERPALVRIDADGTSIG